MKKPILIIAFILLPLSLTAMKPISESKLSDITCQTGVSIIFDITMDIHFGIIAWGDPDGYGNAQSSPQAGSAAGSYTGASESVVADLLGSPYVVRVEPGTMTLKPGGSKVYLYDDLFGRTVLSKP